MKDSARKAMFAKRSQPSNPDFYGSHNPDEILGGNWGSPEETKNDLYNMTSHNYDTDDFDKYENMITKKMGRNSNGQFSANALSLFLKAKGVTNRDLMNDLVMEYGKGRDPIF